MIRGFQLLMCCTALALSGCGWQLRGLAQYDPDGARKIQSVALQNLGVDRQFEASVKRQLKDLGVSVNESSPITVSLGREDLERRPLSYSQTGVPVQYQLIMSISYAVAGPGQSIATEKRLMARRLYDFDAALVVAKSNEERQLIQEMRDELAARLLADVAQ